MYGSVERRIGRQSAGFEGQSGVGLMEVIVGVLMVLILGSVFVHFARLGYAMYRLNSASTEIADQLNKARQLAIQRNQQVNVIFDHEQNRFGIDRNGNSKLERAEAEEIPEDINLKEGCTVSFMPSGGLPSKSNAPKVTIRNSRGSRNITVSSAGSIEIE